MANNASKLSSLDAEKADRAAASIRPSWDFDHADFEAAPAAPAKVEAFDKKLALPAPPPAEAAAPVPFAAGADIPRDTVIDGMPTVSVGRTIDIGPAPEDVQAKPDRAPPPARPQATRFGLGSDPGPSPAASTPNAPAPSAAAPSGKTANGTSILPRTSPEAVAVAAAAEAAGVQAPVEAAAGAAELPLPPKRIESTAAFTPGDVGEIAPLEIPVDAAPADTAAAPAARVDSVAPAAPLPIIAPSSAPIAPIAASISRIEDPIEIPRKSSGPIFWVIGGAVALAAIIGGVVLLTGSDETPANEPTKSTSNAAADKPAASDKPAATPAPTTPPAPTTAATPATPEASATPSASSAPSAAAEASAAPSAKPTTAPTAVAATNPTTPPKPTGTAPKQPPPKGTGGIRRDTPF